MVIVTFLLGEKEKVHLAGTWGKIVVDLEVSGERFVEVVGANHIHATLGDVTEEIETTCRLWNIPVVRLDSEDSMEKFYYEVRSRGKV